MDAWGTERTAAVAFVIVLPVILCLLFQCKAWIECFACLVCTSCNVCWIPRGISLPRPIWFFVALVLSAFWGGLGALWAHWVPCFWTACDLSDDDDVELRGWLLFAGWPALSVALLLWYARVGSACGFTRSPRGARGQATMLPTAVPT